MHLNGALMSAEEPQPNPELVKKQWESFYCLHLAFNE